MKRKVMMCGVILVLGLLALGCGDDDGGIIPTVIPPPGPYYGTSWYTTGGNFETITFTSDSAFQIVDANGDVDRSGTYTYDEDDDTVEFTFEDDSTETITVTNDTMVLGGRTYTKQVPLTGTSWWWKGDHVETITFTSASNYQSGAEGDKPAAGTYTYLGNTVDFSSVQLNDATVTGNTMTFPNWRTYTKQVPLIGTSWIGKDNGKNQIITFAATTFMIVTEGSDPMDGTYTYSCDTVTFTFRDSNKMTATVTNDTMTLSSGNPYTKK